MLAGRHRQRTGGAGSAALAWLGRLRRHAWIASMTSTLGPLLAFVLILALIPAALWLLKRSPLGGASGNSGLRLVGALALSPNQRLVTVEVGSGDDRRWLVLGVSSAGIQTLHSLPPQAESAAQPASKSLAGFAQLLQRQRAAQTPTATATGAGDGH